MNIKILLAFLIFLGGCTSYSYKELDSTTNARNSNALPTVHIVSPAGYDYYHYIFNNLNAFEEVLKGYANNGLEIRIQRDSSPTNQGTSFGSLMLSALTLFLIPSVTQFEESLTFSVYDDGKKIKTYEYSTTKYMTTGLFNIPDSNDDGSISRKIDTDIVKIFINDFSKDFDQI